MKNIALIVASGIGQRFGFDLPKQFILVNAKPLLVYTLERFQENENIDEIIVVTLKEWINEVLSYKENYNISKLTKVVEGGQTRQESVYEGLKNVGDEDSIILIHDGARPLVSQKTINNCINRTKEKGNAIAAIRNSDTLARVDDGQIIEYPDRSNTYNIQTPQSFVYRLIMSAHKNAIRNGVTNASDDSMLLSLMNQSIYVVDGNKDNIKITTKEDLDIFKLLINNR